MAATKPLHGKELMFPSDYLSAVEFDGQDVTLTIKTIEKQDLVKVGGSKERKWVIQFEETPKKWVLNTTNAGLIVPIHGNQATKWVGKKITLFPTICEAFGDPETPCIRVRKEAP